MAPLLTEDEYKATMGPDPVRVGTDQEPPFDFWPYVDSVPEDDLDGHDFSEGRVPYVWQMPDGVHQHVLVECETPNVFLVLVLDLRAGSVLGHHLLDLNRLYGLT
ncbi:hypothetical protein ACFO0M_25165 [Micromonospora mangrovi]|uniref:Uncharacterized protein n=2 Tax=Micromonospora TaxID=1873 RepID=A0AAU7MCK0_9ACTN